MSLIEVGKSPTLVNLSRELGITRQAVHGMFHRHPDLLAWIDRHVSAANAHYTGLVVRRVLNLAIQGSPQHAEICLRAMGGSYARLPGGGERMQAPTATRKSTDKLEFDRARSVASWIYQTPHGRPTSFAFTPPQANENWQGDE